MNLMLPILIPTVLGYLIISVLLGNDRDVTLTERIALAYPLGIGLITLQMFFLGIVRVPLQIYIITSLVLLEIAFISVWGYRKNIRLFRRDQTTASCHTASERQPYKAFLEFILVIWIWVKLGTVFYETTLRPIYSFDTITNWAVRAKLFYYSHSLLLHADSSDFFGRGVIHSYGNYPPLNPLAQMWMALWIGNFDEMLVKLWTPFYLVCAAIYLYKIALKETNRLTALVLVIMLVSSPFVAFHSAETMSDLPLAVYILFALHALLNVIRGRMSYLPLVGLFAVLAMFIKGEGTFIALPIFISTACVLWQGVRDGKYSLKAIIIPALLPYLLIVPWLIFKVVYDLGNGADEIYLTLVFRPMMALDYIKLIFGLQNFNVVFIFIFIALIINGKPDKEILLLSFPIVVYAAFFVSLYVFMAYYSDLDRFSAAVFRNILTYYPASFLILILLIRRMTAIDVTHRSSSTDQ